MFESRLRRQYINDKDESKFLVFFKIDKELPLVGVWGIESAAGQSIPESTRENLQGGIASMETNKDFRRKIG